MFPKFALERGCRTVVFYPDDEEISVGIAVQYKPHLIPSFAAFNTPACHSVYAENENVLLETKFVPPNVLEYEKLYTEAEKAKPERLDEMASEDIFYETKAECMSDFSVAQRDYMFGNDAIREPPEAKMQIHALFKAGGHLNYEFGERCFPITYSILLEKFLEYSALYAIKNVPKPEAQIIFSNGEQLPGNETPAALTQSNQEEINYEQINSMSLHIYGNEGRTAIPREKVPLFHKRRRLDFNTYPEDLQHYIAVIILPDDVTHSEMRIWEEIVFDRLEFAGVEFVTRSAALIGFSGRPGVCFGSSVRQSSIVCVEPFYPILNAIEAPLAVNISSLIHAFQFFMKMCPELQNSAKLLGCLVDVSDVASKNFDKVFTDLGVPVELINKYVEESEAYETSAVSNILFEANEQVLELFGEKGFSLNGNDNFECKFRICFPVPDFENYGIKEICAVEASVRLGAIGLAVGELLNHPGALPPALRSTRFQDIVGPRDPLLEQRDVPKTTKVELERHELGDVLVEGRRVVDFGEELSEDNVLAGVWDLLAGFFRFICSAHLKNEGFMRSQGRRVEEERNAESEAQELLVSRKKAIELFQNAAFYGRLWHIGGFRETMQQTLQSAFPEYEPSDDEFLSEYDDKLWLAAAMLSLTDGMMENCVCREEQAGIGSRVWIEKAPFLYP